MNDKTIAMALTGAIAALDDVKDGEGDPWFMPTVKAVLGDDKLCKILAYHLLEAVNNLDPVTLLSVGLSRDTKRFMAETTLGNLSVNLLWLGIRAGYRMHENEQTNQLLDNLEKEF